MRASRHIGLLAVTTSLASAGWAVPAAAQEGADENVDSATIIVTGTRRSDRTVADSAVPIDVISADSLQNSGTTETNRLLNNLVPSFNFPQPSLTDGTDSLRPATLRGLAPDQVLVLVNGKRRHLSSLLNLNGSIGRGSAGVDMNTIPPIAIDRIEVLRDGASSQYGSDAIAGVINIQLKKREGGRAQVSYGKYITTMQDVAQVASVAPTLTASSNENPVITFTGKDRKRRDGSTLTMATNIGLPVGDSGYLNLTAEYKDRSPTNRSGPDLRRNYAGLGDPRETTFNRYAHRFGDGESQDLNFFYNAGMDVGASWELYSFGSYGVRDANGAGFYRRALDSRNADWDNGGQPIYPDGFLPLITSTIRDIAVAGGLRGETGGWNLDLSINYGSNQLDYGVENSVNTSLGSLGSPRKFDAGGLRSGQTSVNIDVQRDIDIGMGDTSLAFGGEWRNENYKIVAGEPASYIAGPYAFTNNAAPGAQVFPGFSPTTAIDKSRDSFAGYLELDADLSEMINVQAAGRYEHFSDFGDTINGKLAARIEPVEGFALRGSVSTGFRAPGMAQQYFSTTSTNNVGGTLIEIGTFPVGSPIAVALGAQPLKPEKSLNFGGGITFNMVDGLSLTVDYYRIKIKDRITLTENLQGADVRAILQAAQVQGTSARFFINGIDTRTQGLDVVGSYRVPDFGLGTLRLNFGYNINDTKITDRRIFSAFTAQRLFARQESFRLTDGQPSNKFNAGLTWDIGAFGMTLNANRYGSVFLPDGVTATAANGEAVTTDNPAIRDDIRIAKGDAPGDITLSPKWVVDLEVRFKPTELIEIAAGANNLLDEYPDRLPFGTVNGVNFGLNNSFLPYSSQSPFGFSGRFVYGRVSVNF
ncbi:MAG: TonB-dependent receptor [Sphingopyxis sp.]|uniref:TonB-dependent receptor plug domain-containing protein n=1 Tax=Sphingopyxis sp. TaxID=1908224 RepID=UPI002ABD089B|nr:TonB-dependent receptor [Sphingopyxis sp.]MDZ3831251.1 TonB-dependent receptor [Sphingopyxis sp.]